ncbi:TetR family transcriptional regulator [Ureibacillus thermophilus]|uniref:TetR family transcriptional regulator n=2 Tax=Ureibacillus thermophilus TaxID=367743 RepID=A0A4V1A2R8_9BACL|nr:TetR family transcriptional regulator [Ureibacillus thermophilus]
MDTSMKNNHETKKLLSSSLKELMKKKPVEQISIREITELAGLNRQTFYYHFEDIYDLLKWTFQQEALVLIDVHESAKVWQEGLLQLFHYLDENRDICLCALQSLGREHIKRFFYSDIHDIIYRVVYEFGIKLQAQKEYVSFLSHFFTLSLGAIVESWLNGELEQSPEELVNMIDLFVQDQLRGAEQRIFNHK